MWALFPTILSIIALCVPVLKDWATTRHVTPNATPIIEIIVRTEMKVSRFFSFN
jgi:hypothetical protein